MIFYRLLTPRPAARAGARAGPADPRRALQCRRLAPLQALAREPRHRPGLHAVVRAAARIDRALRRAGRGEDRRDPRATRAHARSIVVAHSMGGLVMRAYLRRFGGSKVAQTGDDRDAARRQRPCVDRLRPIDGAAAAAQSLARPSSARRKGADLPPIVSLWSWHDSMVAPQTSSRVASARTSRSPASATPRCFATAEVFERVLAGDHEGARGQL